MHGIFALGADACAFRARVEHPGEWVVVEERQDREERQERASSVLARIPGARNNLAGIE